MSLGTGLLTALGAHWHWPLLLVPVALFVRMALNAIDGMLAREHGMQTPEGALLNELGDVLSDTALYLPFALIPNINAGLVVVVVVLAVVSEMTGVVAVQIGAPRCYDGPMGKSDRAFLFGIIGLLLGLGLAIQLIVNITLAMLLSRNVSLFFCDVFVGEALYAAEDRQDFMARLETSMATLAAEGNFPLWS